MPTIAEKCRTFRELHQSGCFVLPNPWDIGSARYLQHAGFKALATTSSGFAWSQGHPDNWVPRDAVLAHCRELVAATDLPVNCDFEAGFADDPAGVAESVRLCVETGVAGLSIEDAIDHKLLPFEDALPRIAAARAAIDQSGSDTLLVGRSEGFLCGMPDIDETIRRLKAYSEAGADCLYAPGIRSREHIEAVVQAVAPKPVNLLVGFASELTVADYAAMGVRRISIGGAMARAAWGGFIRAAKQLADGGFGGLADAAPHAELNTFFRDDLERRSPTP
jgi:2-methylisocitrate lyase-like PEP mutase family enzyme